MNSGLPVLSLQAFSVAPDPLVNGGGQVIVSQNVCSLNASYGGDSAFKEASLGLSFFGDNKTQYDLVVACAPAERLLRSQSAEQFVATEAKLLIRTADGLVCTSAPKGRIVTTVAAARGTMDIDAHTLDAFYERTLDIEIDFSEVGCGVGAYQTHIQFALLATSAVFRCNDLFSYSDAGLDDEGGVDAGASDHD